MSEASQIEITIIGAGIVGVNTALRLQAAGHRVQIIDMNEPAQGCSSGNAGVIAVYGVTPVSMPGLWKQVPKMLMDPMGPLTIRRQHALKLVPWLMRFMKAGNPKVVEHSARALAGLVTNSYQDYRQITAKYDLDEYIKSSPILAVYESRAHFERDRYAWDLRRRNGIQWDELSTADLHALEPSLSAAFDFAVAMPGSGFVRDPQGFTQALFMQFIRNGGQFKKTKVLGIRPNGGTTVLNTSTGEITTQKTVIAAGAFSAQLTEQLGDKIPLQQERGYHLTLSEYAGTSPRHAIMSPKHKVIVTPMDVGIRIAGMVEFGGFLPPNYARSDVLYGQLQELFPTVEGGQRSNWMGHRPTLPDSLPVIDRSTVSPHVYYAFGHQHVGLTSAPKTAQLITEMIEGQTPALDIKPFSAKRF